MGYRSFDELAGSEREGTDYRIRVALRQSPVLIMALHGGGIEPGTSEIARHIAGEEYSLFMFEGIKDRGNRTLHVDSDCYELPQALSLVEKAERVITIHGCREEDAVVMVGGLDLELRELVCTQLAAKGFEVRPLPRAGLGGMSPRNLCNRNRRGAGVQIEVSRGQRALMFRDLDRSARKEMTATFYRFCDAVRSALAGLQTAA